MNKYRRKRYSFHELLLGCVYAEGQEGSLRRYFRHTTVGPVGDK
jgi:hypothetical protein